MKIAKAKFEELHWKFKSKFSISSKWIVNYWWLNLKRNRSSLERNLKRIKAKIKVDRIKISIWKEIEGHFKVKN